MDPCMDPGIIYQMMMMMIGLNPGPRARTVKPGPRHLRTRPDPGQIPQGHTFGGGTPAHTSRYRGCDLSLSSHSPTANQGGAECHHCGHPQQNRCPMHEASAPPHPNHAKGPDLAGTITSKCTPLKGYTQEPRLPTGPGLDTLTQDKLRHWN